MSQETQTSSALSDYVKNFLMQQKDSSGTFRYVEDIDKMMASNSKSINIDYNDLVTHPEIESVFNEKPDEILEAFSRAIKEILNERFWKIIKSDPETKKRHGWIHPKARISMSWLKSRKDTFLK